MEQTLGKRIVLHRKRLGMTQDKLAEQLGVTAQAVSKWENDQACPDITMLPRLAEIFSITTDELLGLNPPKVEIVHEAEIVDEADNFRGVHVTDDGKGKIELKWDGGQKSGIGLALWVLLTGGLLLASALLGWDAGFWDILWPSGLLVFGLFGLFPGFSFFRLGCSLFGAYFLLKNLNFAPFHFGAELILPVFLLLFGLSLLFDALKNSKKPKFTVFHDGKPIYTREGGKDKFSSYCNASDEHFECSTSFGEDRRRITASRLTSGEANVSFGELTVDLSGCAEIADHCRIQADCSFGALRILVPKNCRVEPATSTAFAAVGFHGEPDSDADRVIHLNCSASFGEIEIRYI